jgi:hypothetical protein
MDRRELLDRSRQELCKRADALGARLSFDFVKSEPSGSGPPTGNFFFNSCDVPRLLQLMGQRLPSYADHIVAGAEKVCAHHFNLLGYEGLDYGPSIDWHMDRVHGITAPRKAFHLVRYLDFEEVGDSKVTWELNRHQHFVLLAKAYRLTGNDRYAQEILSQWRDWHAANPYAIGINWASSLEVAFRSLSWMWMYFLLEGTPALDTGFRREWLRAQALNGRHIERYLSTYFSPNTHLLGEGVGLFFLGTLCPELSGAARWKAKGWQIVREEARRQVNSDGLHFEQSTYYHVYALDMLLHAALLAVVNRQSLPKELEQTLERMLNALCKIGLAASPPRFGDDDGGRLFDPGRNRNEHLLDPLAAGAVLFDRGDFKKLAGNLREETIWLLGASGVEKWDRIETETPHVPATSVAFESSGVYVLASGDSQLIVRGGPSVRQSSGHNHADGLSICLHHRGQQLLIDPGTREYVGPGRQRDLFRGTAMHNTLRVEGKDQRETAGPFSWKNQARVLTEKWIRGDSFTLFVGSHDGYERLPSPAVHRRWIVAIDHGIFLVRDVVEGKRDQRLDINWHLSPQLRHVREHIFTFENATHGLAILPALEHGWTEQISEGSYSPVYGQAGGATVFNVSARVSLPAEFITLLAPFADPGTPGTFTGLNAGEGDRYSGRAYRYQTIDADCYFFFRTGGDPLQRKNITTDAEFLCLVHRDGSADPDIILCNGSYVAISGLRIVNLKRVVQRYEKVRGRNPHVSCSDSQAFENK